MDFKLFDINIIMTNTFLLAFYSDKKIYNRIYHFNHFKCTVQWH